MVTTQLLWRATVLFVVIDVLAIGFTLWVVPSARFLTLKRATVVAAFFVWFGIWLAVVSTSWHSVYSYVFPASTRWLLPPFFGVAFALAALLLFSLSERVGRYLVATFILLGACLGPVTHVNAILRGIVEKPPMLRGASPVAAIAVAFPEFGLYWCLIVLLAAGIARFFPALANRPLSKA